ncbi:uncharacterized protein LOC123867686 [Maniola jurtina]|uniref:uncharacterized protein LOC123867686 n=1 Tax=Maniola jurtina TaxID=191418 RepID=UPI001E68929D|nr:uncharacterized protein LOC123867686 [Maniola jurtina]
MLIIFLISQKLDPTTSLKWEESRSSLKDIPTLDDFFQFLKNRADVFETIKSKRRSSIEPSPKGKREFTKSFSATSSPSKSKVNFVCPVCKGKHRIYECLTFKNKSPEDRSALVSSLNLCRNCLRKDHTVDQCRLPGGGCKTCNQRHNSLIHVNVSESEEEPALETVTMSSTSVTEVLLCTALVDLFNPTTNEKVTVRALLDSGSQSSFLTTAVKKSLGLPSQKIDTKIIGIGDTKLNVLSERCLVHIKSKHSSFNTTISSLVLPKLTGQLPKISFDITRLNISNFQLADPTFNIPSDIDVILGAELFWCIIGTEQHSLGEHYPILRSSKLGWLIAGPICPSKKAHKYKPTQETSCNLVSCDSDLSNEITKFLELEKVPTKTIYKEEEHLCEQHFLQNTYRCDDGHFCVKIPLRCDKDCLGSSYALAGRSIFNLEGRFNKQPLLKQSYVEFMREYADLKHLSVYDKPLSESSFYLPHHPVLLKLTNKSTTTEISELNSHAPTSQNPAYLVSRGVQPSCVNQCELWWHGPTYLLEPEASWPAQEHRIKNLPEIKALAVEAQEPFFDLTRISRFPILQRSYAWVLRCINDVRKSKNKLTGPLQASELDNSMCAPVKISQGQSFANGLTLLSNNKQFKASSLLSSLDTVIDAKSILRVGGHLSMSDFNYDKKCPILLYADSHLTKILFHNERDRLKSGEFQDSVQDFVSKQNIEFEFSLVYALNFSGLWEAGTKATKFHPKRVMCTSNLTFEELSSLFAQVESILNSRPLCPLSPSPNDLQCLTPGHFLIGRPLMSLPSPPLQEINTNRLDRFQRLEQAHQHFWKRWANVYVAELQKRTKWRTRCTTLKVHDLVLLKEPSAPPLCWRLSRVTQLHPSADDVPRVADISTAQGIVRRALNRICLLPTSCS